MYVSINNIDTYLKHLNLDIIMVKGYMMYHYSKKILKRTALTTKAKMLISDLCKMVKIEHIRIN
ncbi:MAG: hypothetical protein CSA21_00170 [Deltaproteobacteria bacterium]|nr:MAG: hypothetical protein CSA21_00170 [Deltaproteobacteria bacterium]